MDQRRGQRLRGSDSEWGRLRKAANLSITELADRSGIQRSLVGLICQGRLTPTPDQARRLLAAMPGEEVA